MESTTRNHNQPNVEETKKELNVGDHSKPTELPQPPDVNHHHEANPSVTVKSPQLCKPNPSAIEETPPLTLQTKPLCQQESL